MQSEISQSDISEMDQNASGAAAYFGQTRNEIGGTAYSKGARNSLLTPGAGAAASG